MEQPRQESCRAGYACMPPGTRIALNQDSSWETSSACDPIPHSKTQGSMIGQWLDQQQQCTTLHTCHTGHPPLQPAEQLSLLGVNASTKDASGQLSQISSCPIPHTQLIAGRRAAVYSPKPQNLHHKSPDWLDAEFMECCPLDPPSVARAGVGTTWSCFDSDCDNASHSLQHSPDTRMPSSLSWVQPHFQASHQAAAAAGSPAACAEYTSWGSGPLDEEQLQSVATGPTSDPSPSSSTAPASEAPATPPFAVSAASLTAAATATHLWITPSRTTTQPSSACEQQALTPPGQLLPASVASDTRRRPRPLHTEATVCTSAPNLLRRLPVPPPPPRRASAPAFPASRHSMNQFHPLVSQAAESTAHSAQRASPSQAHSETYPASVNPCTLSGPDGAAVAASVCTDLLIKDSYTDRICTSPTAASSASNALADLLQMLEAPFADAWSPDSRHLHSSDMAIWGTGDSCDWQICAE